ncbi:MAG: hypothetical protein IJH94_02925 [Clostridia bacterium]|nr:hypothetical protein [Clostridia bacterium]
MNEFWTGVTTTLACLGGIWLGLQFRDWVAEKWKWYKTHKGYRADQKARKKAREFACGDRRPAPINVAKQYAAELPKRNIVPALMAGAEQIDMMRCAAAGMR